LVGLHGDLHYVGVTWKNTPFKQERKVAVFVILQIFTYSIFHSHTHARITICHSNEVKATSLASTYPCKWRTGKARNGNFLLETTERYDSHIFNYRNCNHGLSSLKVIESGIIQ